jgi:hypothetical protein
MGLGLGALSFGLSGGVVPPAAGAPIDITQRAAVDSNPTTLGVIDFAQSAAVEGVPSTSIDIAGLAGMVWVFDQSSTIVRSDASITFGSALDNAAWTKTNCTITANTTGTQDRVSITSGASAASVQQAMTNVQFVSTGMVPCTITWWFSYESIQWIVICGRNGSTVNRQWFDIQNGVLGATDATMGGASITPETRNGVAGYRCSVNVIGSGGALYARIAFSTTNTTITNPATATTVLCDDCTVQQQRVESVADRVSGQLFSQATVNNQPGYGEDSHGHYIAGYGASLYLVSTHSAHVAAVAGTNIEYTLHLAFEPTNIDALCSFVGAGDSAQATNRTRLWGTSTTGNGRYTSNTVDDAGTAVVATASADTTGDAHVGEWYTSSSGTQVNHKKNGAAANPSATAQGGTVTPTRVALLITPRATPVSPGIGKLYACTMRTGAPDNTVSSQIRQNIGQQLTITVAP